MDAVVSFAEHVARTTYEDLPENAVQAAKTYILDTLGVGIAGSAGPWMDELIEVQGLSGKGDDARVWGRGDRLPAPAAALCNGYQIHNSEFDCVHEAAVLHPMTVVLAATLAFAEREGKVTGKDLITAMVLGVDVACHLGVAVTSAMKFFRPATAGAMAAVAGIGKCRGFEAERLVNAFSIAYGQLCGNMQAHTEGSILLGMQIGFNARNAIVACDMAARGLEGPKQVFEGQFGFLNLIEGAYDLKPVMADLGRVWRITEVAHKPFPSGRATHGVVDAVMTLKREHGFEPADIERVEAWIPPLTHHLVGRPIQDDMAVNYARLCTAYVAARALLRDFVGVEDFAPEVLNDAETLALGRRFEIRIDDNPDPNALTPIRVEMALKDGSRHEITIDTVYGNPAKPMTLEAHLAKFRRNWEAGARPLSPANAE
ncbi:MAG: MmgE/PrpD family protein, partial [Alphaproteobacteria bacterium]|nr:MmgE/PrpD family protein [Alphaproteobacteria bacterium]